MQWPSFEQLNASMSLPTGVVLRAWRDDELDALPGLLASWYPAVTVGAESVFLEHEFLKSRSPNFWMCAIEQHGVVVGFQAFELEKRRRTLHGRLGMLAPEARAGFLGALGFPLFETLGALVGAELLMVWVTLATKGQQVLAQRRGFVLSGIVRGFDIDQQPDGTERRVSEALYTKLLCGPERVLAVDDASLTEHTRRVITTLS